MRGGKRSCTGLALGLEGSAHGLAIGNPVCEN